jgi:hypothetical protein
LYSLYSCSTKNTRELGDCSIGVEERARKFGRLISPRWIASSYRTMSAVWDSLHSLCTHFEEASRDMHWTNKENAAFGGLLRMMPSPDFLVNLGMMHDALFKLSSLSVLLQHRSNSIVYADKLIRRTIRALETLKEKVGNKTLEAKCAANELKFKVITLSLNKINDKQFLISLINNMSSRLLCTTAHGLAESNEDILKTFTLLDKDRWPADLVTGYGEEEVKTMWHRFIIPFVKTVNAFRDYVDDIGRREPPDLKPLLNYSTVEYERRFSLLNIIVSNVRCNLPVSHVS